MEVVLKIPAIEKLLDYVASGLGAVAGPVLAPWKAHREAKAKRIEAEARADSLKLIADAQADARRSLLTPDQEARVVLDIGSTDRIQQRIKFQERKRQANIVSVVRGAASVLEGKEVDDHEPDPDWTAQFFNCVQDVSSEDMKKIWTKILAGEVERPGRTSIRTLDVLKNMSRKEAEIFDNFCDFVINDFVFYPSEYQRENSPLPYDNIILLHTMGLVYTSPNLVKNMKFFQEMDMLTLSYQRNLLIVKRSNQIDKITAPVVLLTVCGKELCDLSNHQFRMDYLQSFSDFVHNEGCSLSYLSIDVIRSQQSGNQAVHSIPIPPDAAQFGAADS